LAEASNESEVVDAAIFGDLSGYFFGNFRVRPTVLYGDIQPLVGL